MPEAVFTISADIEPRLDQRELERQAQLLSGQLNGILAKQVTKIGVSGDTRSFNEFKQSVTNTTKVTDTLRKSIDTVKTSAADVAKASKGAFLKFTDAINVTRRDIVGFGGSIADTIRNTDRFFKALGNIKANGGGVFDELNGSFQSTIASVRSGTSILDQFAQRGDHLAQLFLPFTRTSAAAQLNLEGLQQTLQGVASTFQNAFNNAGKKGVDTLDASSVSTGSLNARLNHLQRAYLDIGRVLPKGTKEQKAYFDTFNEAKAAGGVDDFVKAMVQQRDAANRLAGPLGLVKQSLHLVTKETRDGEKALRDGLNQQLVQMEQLFPGTVVGLDHLVARFRNTRDAIGRGVESFTKFRAGLAAIIPGANLGQSLVHFFDTTDATGKAGNFFKSLSARFDLLGLEGKSVTQSLAGAFKKTFGELNVVTAFKARVDQVTGAIGRLALSAAAGKFIVQDAFGKAVDATKRFIDAGQRAGESIQGTFAAFKATKFGADMTAASKKVVTGFRLIGQGGREIGAVLADIGKTGLSKLQDAFLSSNFATKSVEILKETGNGLRSLGTEAVRVGKGLGAEFSRGLDTARISARLLADNVGDKLGRAFTATKSVGAQLGAELGTRFSSLRVLLGPIGQDVSNLGKAFGSLLNIGSAASGGLSQGFGVRFAGVMDSAQARLKSFGETALLVGKAIGSPVVAPFIHAFSAVKDSVEKGITAFKNSRFAEPLLAGLKKVKDGFSIVAEGSTDAGKAIGDQAGRSATALGGKLAPTLARAKAAFSKAKGTPEEAATAPVVKGLVSGVKIDSTVAAPVEGELDKLLTQAIPLANSGGERIGESIARGIISAITKAGDQIQNAIAKVTDKVSKATAASAKEAPFGPRPLEVHGGALAAPTVAARQATAAAARPVVDATRPALQRAGAASDTLSGVIAAQQPKTISLPKVADATAQFTAVGRANGAALAQGTLDGANFETKVGGAIVAQINGITGAVATPVDAAGRTIGADYSAGILNGVGVNAKNVEAKLSGQAADSGKKAGSALGRAVGDGVKAPFNAVKDVLTTTFRASLGKGPAEGIGAIGKAAGVALTPLRLFAKAAGETLSIGLNLSTAALKVAGTAFAGFLGVAVATGVQFNSLQAVVRATLPVMLGSAEATNKLLVQVNALNDTSPFARSAFLSLTQVLAGFGVQAEKITPLIDAIQQAVAATGGGEQDLQELGQAFARLQSQGRLSLDILQSFSSRGIDAIGILGQSFGKTQSQIRDMISGGLIPADQAIDALTKGLKDKFDGATDAVSKNLPGALDRVKAKTRDFGAALTKAFVNPNGGGAAIDLLNAFATVVGTVTKVVLPLLAPALQKVADGLTLISQKATDLTKTFVGGAGQVKDFVGALSAQKGIKDFAGQLDGLIGPLAALAAFIPSLLAVVPVVGPLFESLVGGIPTAVIAVGAFLLTLKPVRDGLGELGKSLIPIGATLLPKLSNAFRALGEAVGPTVGRFFAALGPIVKAAGNALGELFDQLVPIFGAFQRLFDALSPDIDIIKDSAISWFQVLQGVFRDLGPIIKGVIDFFAGLAEAVKPALQHIADMLDKFNQMDGVSNSFKVLGHDIQSVIDELSSLKDKAETVVNFLHAKGILKFAMKVTGTDAIIASVKGIMTPVKTAAEMVKEQLQQQNDAADKAADHFRDLYGVAKKAAEDAASEVSKVSDQLKQQMTTFSSQSDALLSASAAVKTAKQAEKDATTAAHSASKALTQALKDQAKALRDVISPADELAKAQRDLAKTQTDLMDIDRQGADLQTELGKLRGEDANDKRAALDRGLLRAKIALNKAQEDENNLLKAANAAKSTNVDLTGLTLDQMTAKLNNVRLSLEAQSTVTTPAKTAQDIADEKMSAHLDVADAAQGVKDATKDRSQFEIDTANTIRDDEQKIVDLQGQKADLKLTEIEQTNHLADLKAGETAQALAIRDWEEKIRVAKEANTKAQRDLTAAVKATALAQAELQSQQDLISQNVRAQAEDQLKIFNLKKDGQKFDAATENSLKTQLGIIQTTIDKLDAAKISAAQTVSDLKKASVAALSGMATQNDNLSRISAHADKDHPVDAATLTGLDDLADNIKNTLNNVSSSGAILDKQGHSVILTKDQVSDILLQINEEEGVAIGHGQEVDFRKILRAILDKIHLSIPDFAVGYAPGEVHRGMNNGRGLVRMFEYGREAVLPLTRAMDMQRIVNHPHVLPAILSALPKISLPRGSNEAASLSSFDPSTSGSGFKSAMASDRRREHYELASSVGEAVKNAVKEALSESDSLGSTGDIHVHPSSGNEVLIGREVKRQVQKALQKW